MLVDVQCKWLRWKKQKRARFIAFGTIRPTTSAGLTKVYTVHREVAPSASGTDHHHQIRGRRPWGEERNYTSSIPYFLLTALFYMFLYITVHLHLIASLSASSFSAGFVEQNVVGGSGCLV